MKRKLLLIILLQFTCVLIANAQVNPVNQVIAYFKTGVTRVPPSDSTASIHQLMFKMYCIVIIYLTPTFLQHFHRLMNLIL